MIETTAQSTPEQTANEKLAREIEAIQQELAIKKAKLEADEAGLQQNNDKNLLKEVIQEQIALTAEEEMLTEKTEQLAETIDESAESFSDTEKPAEAPSQPTHSSPATGESAYSLPELQGPVQTYVNMIFEKDGSITKATEAVLKTNNPALIDAFHDFLADFIEDFSQRGKITPVQ